MLPQSEIDESFADRRLHGRGGDYAMKMCPTGGMLSRRGGLLANDRSATLRVGAAQCKVHANTGEGWIPG